MPRTPAFASGLAEDLGPEDFAQVLRLLRQDVTRLVEVMENAARANDEASFRRAAHGMAGAAGAVGAESLEQASRLAMTRHDIRGSLTAMASEVRRLADELLAEIARALQASGASPSP